MRQRNKKKRSISVFCRIILGGHHQTSSLSRSSVNGFNNVYHLLLVLYDPVDLIVVTGAQINHDVFVSETKKQTKTKKKHKHLKTIISALFRLILLQRLDRALPEKEHDGAGVVQLVHLIEIRHFCDVHQVNDSKILYLEKKVNICSPTQSERQNKKSSGKLKLQNTFDRFLVILPWKKIKK